MNALLRTFSFPSGERKSALDRTSKLVRARVERSNSEREFQTVQRAPRNVNLSALERLLYQAALPNAPLVLIAVSVLCGVGAALIFSKILSLYFTPIFFACGVAFPFAWVEGRARKRAEEFAEDYPTVLLATASSIKAGLTPYMALERSVRLLPSKSMVRNEVEGLTAAFRRGVSKELAVREFAASIRQPDLELFRAAFLLVLENGGRFAPTLERLAMVSKDRSTLISSARVTTTTMRMTANVLLGVAPFLLVIMAGRTPNFWEMFTHHPVANVVASAGLVIITVSYAVLRRMSNFKP